MATTQDYVSAASTTGNDYKGASFTDGSFANATLTLTKAGAFAATKVGHWLYLDDNGSGEVTTGYYRVTNIGGAPNAVVLNADIRSGANDPTDVKCTQHDGTALLPWRSLQGAFDLCTRDTTDGNQVNLLAGTAQVNVAALDLTTFIAAGAMSATAPLIIRGYTATAGDGGVGEIDCNGATMWAATTYDSIYMVDLEIHSFGNNNGIVLDDSNCMFRCEVHKGASAPSGKYLVALDDYNTIIGCYFHDPGSGTGRCISGDQFCFIYGCYVVPGASVTGASYGIYASNGSIVVGCIVNCGQAATTGIQTQTAIGNTVYNSTAGTAIGIDTASIYGNVFNNIVTGFSGVGGDGVGATNIQFVGYNAFYNCTAEVTITDQTFVDLTASDVTLTADPFVDAANGDFSLTAAGKAALRGLGWPGAYLGAHANTDGHVTVGAIQYGEAESGGGMLVGNKRGNKE